MNIKLLFVGVILFTLGTTLAATSYFNLHSMVEANIPYANTILITGRYYAEILDINNNLDQAGIQRIGVFISGSQELQGIVNSTLNYNTTLGFKPITISLSDERTSATVTPLYAPYGQGLVAVHYFDVPNYSAITRITVTNPEDYPVCWDISIIHYSEIININWLVALIIGIIAVMLGLVIIGVAGYKRKPDLKKET
jgi:uncharacterized membrane protein